MDPSRFREYLDGKRRAYVIVAGKHQFFPKRELETIEYSIEDTYQGLYQELRSYLGKARKSHPLEPIPGELSYARYGLWHFVVKDKQRREPYASLHRAGMNLRGLVRVLLFKRFESSVYAFQETIQRLITVHERFKEALSQGIVPAGEDAQTILYEPNQAEEQDLMDALRQASERYDAVDFDMEQLGRHIEHDIQLLKKIMKLVEPVTPEKDAKLQKLKEQLEKKPLKEGKRLIFKEIHDTIGEDSIILDRTEIFNEEAMYAIYEKRGGQLSLFDDEESDLLDINEAEELLRQLRKERPDEYGRISNLRDGIRTGKPSTTRGFYFLCQAGHYQQLFLMDEKGLVVTRDIPRILGAIKCGPDLAALPLPTGYNAVVMRVKRQFEEEVKHRQAEREYTPSLTRGQRYVLRELRVLFSATEDDNSKDQINLLEAAFRGVLTRALAKELNRIRRNGISGQALLKSLGELYYQHNMRDWLDRRGFQSEERPVPMIVCSESLG